jgi:hypothetical protein
MAAAARVEMTASPVMNRFIAFPFLEDHSHPLVSNPDQGDRA